MMIPKIIHFCWFGGNSLPNDVKKCISSWRKFAPNYKIVKWDEKNFDIHCHPFVESAYKAKAWAFVSDYARLKIVHDHGGIYLDTDVELIKNPDFLLKNKAYVGIQQGGKLCATGLGFGAEKNNSVIGEMLKMYDDLIFRDDIKEKIACPRLNNVILKQLGYEYSDEICQLDNITVYPCRFFDPLSPGNAKNLLCDDTVSIHHYSASWTSPKNRYKRKLFNIIGQDKIMKIKGLLGR